MECAFGELVNRWGILWRPIQYKMSTTTMILSVLMRLHNKCVERRVQLETLHKDRTWGSTAIGNAADIRWHSSSDIWLAGGGVEGSEVDGDGEPVIRTWGGARRTLKPSAEYRKQHTEELKRRGILRPRFAHVRPRYADAATYGSSDRNVSYVPF